MQVPTGLEAVAVAPPEPSIATNCSRMVKSLRALAAAAFAFAASPAFACTLCHSDTAERVRAEVFGPDFLFTAVALAVIFPVLAAAVAGVRKLTP